MLHIPDQSAPESALARTTHLGIGAHQDDLEFMAYHGILACYDSAENWFTGVTCTNGAGSSRTGPFAHYSDEEMCQVRIAEQNAAAELGQYAAQYQLGHPSAALKDPANSAITREIADIIRATRPHTIYAHQPLDKHPTHLATLHHTLAALRSLPAEFHPGTFLGCEGWRDLDWLPDARKIPLDVSARPELATELNLLFQSQIAGGKNYHEAIIGRRCANATMSNPHASDEATHITFALDLSPLLADPALSLTDFAQVQISAFRDEVTTALSAFS
ncbi:MAG: PIG-L deacetylase family protein [Verrucomicrobiales bacterium]